MTRVKGGSGMRGRIVSALFLLSVLLAVALAAASYHAIYPFADGKKTYKGGGAVLDASNADQGYVMAKIKSDKKVKVRITGKQQYTYDLRTDGAYDIYPLQDGSGSYRIAVYKQVRGASYSQILSKSIKANLENEYAAFLVPNRYARYDEEAEAVAIARELCADLKTDREKADAVYTYIKSGYTYDYIKAITVKSGYVPDLADTIATRMGICFDYAALMCAMLRSQGIPTKHVMGYADNNYHAWNEILIDGGWVHYDVTAAIAYLDVGKYLEEAVY